MSKHWGWGLTSLMAFSATSAIAQDVVRTVDDLARLTPAGLDALYAHGAASPPPAGKVRGLPLIAPGRRVGPLASRAGRLAWQGKTFDPAQSTAVNRFFGLRMIRGNLSFGPSWRDGQSSLILDYNGTSTVYGRYRDEIRQVAPGVYLGLMYDRSTNPPTFTRYFAFSMD
jgi:hypothetical protein